MAHSMKAGVVSVNCTIGDEAVGERLHPMMLNAMPTSRMSGVATVPATGKIVERSAVPLNLA